MCAVLRSGRLRPDSVRRYRLEMGWTALVAGNRARHARLANRARIHPRYGDDDRIVTPATPNRLAQQCFSAGGECGRRSAVAGWTRRYERHSTQRPEVRVGTAANLDDCEIHAVLHGVDLGPPHPLPRQLHLVDFWLPQRGLFAVGDSAFENFDPTQHALPSAPKVKSQTGRKDS